MSNARLFLRVCSKIALSLIILAVVSIPALGQEAGTGSGVVDDWSHHHQVFSNPGAREDAEKNGTLDRWLKVTNSPRYQLQQLKRNAAPLPAAEDSDVLGDRISLNDRRGRPLPGTRPIPVSNPIEKDWTQPLGGTPASLVSTLAATLSSSNISSSSTITVDGQTFTASPPTASTQTGTFTGVPASAQTVTITATGNTLVLYAIPAAGEGTATLTAGPGGGSTTVVGSVTYSWRHIPSNCGTVPCVYGGGTAAQSAANLEAAINDNAGECGATSGGACFWNITAANTSATATVNGAVTTITNTSAATIPFTSSTGSVTLDPASGIGIPPASASNGCTTSTGGYSVVGTSTTTAASNLATAIAACNTSYPAVGLTASSSAATVTVTSDTPGTTGAAGLSLADTLSNFTWAGTTLTGGTNGTDSAATFKYWNNNAYDTGSQLATDLHTALAANATVSGVITTAAGTNQITFSTTHTGPYSISVANFSAFSGIGTIGSPAIPATVQPNAYPAKYGASLTSASCTGDFVVYPTGQAGSTTAATIIAYTNLYSSCSGTVPSMAWAYNTGTGYAATTSPTLSLDGTKVIFVQSNGSSAELVVLKIPSSATGTLTAPGTVTTVANITSSCSGACMTVTALNGSDDTYSAPFYVYPPPDNLGGDTVFVGTNSGTLLSISPVLNGAAPTGTLPSVTLTGAANVASPVYDIASDCVFVGDTNGYLYSVDAGLSTSASVCKSGTFKLYGRSEQLGHGALEGIFDGPLVDSSAGTVYTFVSESAAGLCTTSANCLDEFATNTITSGSTTAAPAHFESLGAAGTNNPIYAGSFDNIYYSSANGVGNLYVVGGTGLTSAASLYQVPITGNGTTNGVTSAAVSVATVTSGNEYPWSSPLSEFYNSSGTGTDYAFFSVNRGATALGCTGTAGTGCILAFNITSTTVTQAGTGQNYTTPGTNGCWATGGIVIDNSATVAGASEIYFVNLNGIDAGGSGGANPTSANCTAGTTTTLQAVQAQQSNP